MFALFEINEFWAAAGLVAVLIGYASQRKKQSPAANSPGRIPELHLSEVQKIINAINQGESLLIVGEQGSGKSTVAGKVKSQIKNAGLVSYTGTVKPFLLSIGKELKIELTKPKINSKGEEVGVSPMSADEMKTEISENLYGKCLMIDDAHRLPASLKIWFEELHKTGHQLILFSTKDPAQGIFIRLSKIELPAPTDLQIRDIMQRKAIAVNLSLSPSKLAALQRRAGKNLMLAKKIIRDEALGIDTGPEHRDYVDISPFIMAALAGLGVVRFIGLGLGDRTLYIVGGIAVLAGLTIKYFSRGISRNAKNRRLGA